MNDLKCRYTPNVNDFLKKLLDLGSISQSVYNDIHDKGSNPARLYGLAKIHKALVNGIPKFRPIISQIGSPAYKLAKFLTKYITPHTINDYTVKDSFEFSSIINEKDHHLFTASLDVDSLFMNVPLDEAIEIAVKKVYGRKQKIDGIKKSDFKEMLEKLGFYQGWWIFQILGS